jgi:hypothetical protein
MGTKKCKKCEVEKELCDFRIRKDCKSGYGNNCKLCEAKVNKDYREKNKNKIKQKNQKFIETHKDYFKKRYEKNKKQILAKQKINYKKIKDKKLNYDKNYRIINKEKIVERKKQWYNKNKKIIIQKNINYAKKRKETDELYRLKISIKTNIYNSLKRKNYKNYRTHEILSCSFEEFKTHLESKFEPWMTWDNYGLYNGTEMFGWDIDHIIPLSSAKTEKDIIKLNHYTNLQPLCSYINRVVKKSINRFS